MSESTRMQEAFNRYHEAHPQCTGSFLKDHFTDDAGELFGSIHAAILADANDPRWDKLCPPKTAKGGFKLTEAEKADVVEEVKHYLDEDVYEFGVYVRKFCVTGGLPAAKSDNIVLVEKELWNAKEKHPRFVKHFSLKNESDADEKLFVLRRLLEMCEAFGDTTFPDVLKCEVAEAVSAYAHGELEHARQKLAQCAAVCIRGMEYIQAELAKGK